MKKYLNFSGILLAMMLISGVAEEDPWEKVLPIIGYTKETLKFDRLDMNFFGGDKYRLHFFDVFIDSPLKIPNYVPYFAEDTLKNSESIGNLLMRTAAKVKTSVRRSLIFNPVEGYRKKLKETDVLPNAIQFLYEKNGKKLPKNEYQRLQKTASEVPPEVAKEVALLVVTSAEVLSWRDLAFQKVAVKDVEKVFGDAISYVVGIDSEQVQEEVIRRVESFADQVDFLYLNTGGIDLALTLDEVVKSLSSFHTDKKFSFHASTPVGAISIRGAGDDSYSEKNPFILVDVGGNDTYTTGASSSPANPISILIDLQGNDTYISEDAKVPSFGAGILGWAYLVDLQGNDTYRSKSLTQGAGFFGAGILMDRAGDDSYDAFAGGQGAGFFGVGVLSDLQGNDSYALYQQGQGYGWVLGSGLLVDVAGDDIYTGNDSDIKFPAAQTKEHNSSLVQGMGMGKRADFTDGHSLAGGVGILVDGDGNDHYSCGVFGQGQAYWYGVGILADKAGNDEYKGVWYVQGAGAHFGVGILWEGGGNDHYSATHNMAQGAGHDFTVGFLIDEAGDDVYDAPNLSLGAGNANGMGLFWDKSGKDIYRVSADLTLGKSSVGGPVGLIRDFMPTIGIFLDTGGGEDSYPKPFARDNILWIQPGSNQLPSEKGAGLDL